MRAIPPMLYPKNKNRHLIWVRGPYLLSSQTKRSILLLHNPCLISVKLDFLSFLSPKEGIFLKHRTIILHWIKSIVAVKVQLYIYLCPVHAIHSYECILLRCTVQGCFYTRQATPVFYREGRITFITIQPLVCIPSRQLFFFLWTLSFVILMVFSVELNCIIISC